MKLTSPFRTQNYSTPCTTTMYLLASCSKNVFTLLYCVLKQQHEYFSLFLFNVANRALLGMIPCMQKRANSTSFLLAASPLYTSLMASPLSWLGLQYCSISPIIPPPYPFSISSSNHAMKTFELHLKSVIN